MRFSPNTALAAVALLAPISAEAQQSAERAESEKARPEQAVPTAPQQPTYHRETNPAIIVTGVLPTSRQDMLSGVAVVQGAQLTQALRPSLGETLGHTPGVSATSFGPSASRPVLRGLQGERVRVLNDGLGAIDVSNTSVDHATVVNPLLADRIEVLRGPQSLLYGSAAIGGVVNVIDRRIPVAVPDEPVHLGAIATYGSAAKERSLAGSVDVPLAGHWVAHADGSYLKTDDVRIGGYALTRELRAQAVASSVLVPDPGGEDPIDFAANANVRGRLPNTASKTWNAGAGLAYIGDGGSLGVAYSHYDSLYGVPIRFATEPGVEQEAPRLSLVQNRFDARAQIDTGGGMLDRIAMRFAYANYRHFELGPDGAVGTAFYNKGMEGRLELTQARRGAWHGVTGAQFFSRDFDVVGDEAFLPKNRTEQVGLFTLQQIDLGRWKLEAGARFEHTALRTQPGRDPSPFFAGGRSFDVVSASGGASFRLGGDWRIGVNVSRTERAPSAEELFANGPHAGTASFELGNPNFKPERAWSAEAILRGGGKDYSLEGSVFYSRFSNFIYQDSTSAIEDGLPVFAYGQANARYWGFEVQGEVTLARWGETKLSADALADYVRATIDGVGPAPRIPPLRLLGGLALKAPRFDLRGEVERVSTQRRVSAFETPTAGYTMVNLEANIRPWGEHGPLSFALSANNLFDVDARRHASVLKDYAPLAGRDLRVTARVNF